MQNNILFAATFTPLGGGRWGLPLLIKADPGEAKTSVFRQLAARADLPLLMLSPGTHGEGAFGTTGVPRDVFVNDMKLMMLGFPPPEYVLKVLNGGILLLDEINTAPPALQPPLLGMLQERRVGFYEFNGRVRVFATANPIESGTGCWELGPSLANRQGHLTWAGPTVKEHGSFLRSQVVLYPPQAEVIDTTNLEQQVEDAWPEAMAWAAGIFSSYEERNPDSLRKLPPEGHPDRGAAWASPRTMEMGCRALASSKIHALSNDETEEFVAAFIGDGNAGELFDFMRKMDLPDALEYLQGKSNWKHDPARLDITYAVMSQCTALLTNPKMDGRVECAHRFWRLLDAMIDSGEADVPISVMPDLVAAGLADARFPEAEAPLEKVREDMRSVSTARRGS